MKHIAILCSGGDVSGMNAALKRFVEYSMMRGFTPYFVENGYEGLIDNTIRQASYGDVAGILSYGGTKIHTSRSERFLDGRKSAVVCQNDGGFNYKDIDEVAFKPSRISEALLQLGREYAHS